MILVWDSRSSAADWTTRSPYINNFTTERSSHLCVSVFTLRHRWLESSHALKPSLFILWELLMEGIGAVLSEYYMKWTSFVKKDLWGRGLLCFAHSNLRPLDLYVCVCVLYLNECPCLQVKQKPDKYKILLHFLNSYTVMTYIKTRLQSLQPC